MSLPARTAEPAAARIHLYCAPNREGDAFRVYVKPFRLPPAVRQYLDRHCERYPVCLDFEDLERRMSAAGAEYTRHPDRRGGMELLAEGSAAEALAEWLTTAFVSGTRASEP